ncbi:MAG TPA: lysylphosphatidylglycerol synthase domain-containing protein [Flavobacterium sp.]|nr:lysylphosphatidylglycerol synthase domain-containing protein [Flavobacterium sp.]
MITLSRKAKQFLVAMIKVLIVGGAFYFIYNRVSNEQLDWNRLGDALQNKHSAWFVFIVLTLTFLNRFLEILKWQNLASSIKTISFGKATEQVMAALTAGIFTPNGIGEYAAKSLYYKKNQAKEIIFLNLICNGIQLIIAVIIGLAGLVVFNLLYKVMPATLLLTLLGIITAVIILVFLSRKITLKGYSLQRIFEKVNAIPATIHRRNMLLAIGRYMCLVHQHYFIFLAFGVELPYPVMISVIACVYFLGSSLPSFQMLDFAVRGSVAVYFFGVLGVNEWIVVLAATLQWLLNIMIPVAIGSYFVFRFKSERDNEAIIPHQE